MVVEESRTTTIAPEAELGAIKDRSDEPWLISAVPARVPESLRLSDLFARSVPITQWGINE